ncbi:DNA-binding XRE family transcriptional regulator [Kitasatospora sp. MAP12-15]|uniref:telomere-associated protein Tap n=1 Tax=unclassified Kitasatospora TaxID=2633591 RepID=UPI002476D50F|nr:helix-turn-helix domain-containing protein [Kitasatospora sp. MAP12-44]MDH6107834.1 DNA-binding XRE family transcriptional regulator [Kitasatospora sp. MAP12-44]
MTEGMDPIDALLAEIDEEELPPPAERKRLRQAAKVTRARMAERVGVREETIWTWETGRSEPRPPQRGDYARLLRGLAERFPALQPVPAPAPAPVVPEAFAAVPVPEQPAPVVQMVMLDQNPDGSLVMGPPLPCVQCGNPSVYRAQNHPMHLGGFCRPAAAVASPATVDAAAAVPAIQQPVQPAPAAPAAPAAAPRRAAPTAGPVTAPRRASSSRPAASSRARKAPAKKPAAAPTGAADWELAAAARYPSGPLAVLDVAADGRRLVAYLADGNQAPTAPTGRTLADVVEWALEVGLGAPRLHRHGKDGDALVALTDAALAELGLPPVGKDEKRDFVPRLGRLPETHKAVKALGKAGWLLTRRGLGPWARIYRTPEDGKRVCVQLCVPGWGALASGGWAVPDGLAAPDLARLLGTYATRVITPRGTTAVSGLELVTALRPPTMAVRTEAGWTSGPVEGSRPKDAFDPAIPEVPDMHPLAEHRAPGDVLVTEAWDWHRPLTDTELVAPFAVGLDVNMAFLAAAGRLTLPLSEPVHELQPAFDKKLPGSWLVDLSHLELDPHLPNPFTADGTRPTGPAWYSTAKVAYALELGAQAQPLESWLRHESGPYLDPWHKRLRQAYVDTMAALGVPLTLADTDPLAFLDAMAAIKQGDPAELAVLTAIKQTAKGTIGKLREKPRQGWKPGQRWAALERATWDPLMRALVIDTATVNLHRKLLRMQADTGLAAFAVLSDCAVFAAPGPGALDILTRPDATLTTSLRLGVSPGHVKFEGSRPMAEIVEMLADGANPARHIKTGGVVSDDE